MHKDNKVIRNSIIWCDQRTGKEVVEITEKVGHDRLIAITANPAITGFTAAKIMWVKNNEPENYEKCRHILLPKDYIRFSDWQGRQKNWALNFWCWMMAGLERETVIPVRWVTGMSTKKNFRTA